MIETFGKVIYAYTRKQAIEDGLQVRCPDDIRKEGGLKVPLFMTKTVWDKYIEVPKGMEDDQDLTGRLWDLITMIHFYARKHRTERRFDFKVIFRMNDADNWTKYEKVFERNRLMREVTLVAESGPIDPDDLSMCITISLPGED